MIALLPLWRIMAWIGVGWADLKVRKGGSQRRWQDKTGAVCVGGVPTFSALLSASHTIARLAEFAIIGAFQPFREPSQARS